MDLESRSVTTWNLSLVGYNNYPVIHGLSGGATDVLTCTPSLLEVVRATDQVCWVHLQVSESSDRPDPLVGDG